MRLYVWTGVLVDYSSGLIVALASSQEEAERVAIADLIGETEEEMFARLSPLRADHKARGFGSILVDMTDEALLAHVRACQAEARERYTAELAHGTLAVLDGPVARHVHGGG